MCRYPAFLDGEAGAYGVTFPDMPGIVAMGETVGDALLNAEEALWDYVTETERDGVRVAEVNPIEPSAAQIATTLWVFECAENALTPTAPSGHGYTTSFGCSCMCSSSRLALPIESRVGIGYCASFACSAIVSRSSNAIWYDFDGVSARTSCFTATISWASINL